MVEYILPWCLSSNNVRTRRGSTGPCCTISSAGSPGALLVVGALEDVLGCTHLHPRVFCSWTCEYGKLRGYVRNTSGMIAAIGFKKEIRDVQKTFNIDQVALFCMGVGLCICGGHAFHCFPAYGCGAMLSSLLSLCICACRNWWKRFAGTFEATGHAFDCGT